MESWIVHLDSLRRLILYSRLTFIKFVEISVYFISLCPPSAYLNVVDEHMASHSSRVLGDLGEMLPKFQQIYKTQLTCSIESTIQKSLLEWDKTTPLLKKVRFTCMLHDLIHYYGKRITWIEVGCKHHASVTSMKMALKISSNLLNWMHHLCMVNFFAPVSNVGMGDTSQ